MEDFEKEAINMSRVQLVKDVILDLMWPHFIQEGIFNDDMLEIIRAEKTNLLQCQKMLSLLPKRGPRAFDKFCRCLSLTEQAHISRMLQHNAQTIKSRKDDKVDEFIVTFNETNLSKKLELEGKYAIQLLPTGLVIRDIHKRQTTQWIDSKHFRSYKQKICEISIAVLPTSPYGEGVLSFSTDDIIQMTKRFHDVIMTARQKEMLETRKQIGTPHDQLDMSGLYSDIQLQNDDQFLVEKEVVKCNDITPDDQNVEEIVPEVPNKCEELCKEMSEIKVKEGVHNDKLKSVQSLETTQNNSDSYRRCYIADSSTKPLVPVKRDHLLQDLQRSSPCHDKQIVPDTNEINESHINQNYDVISAVKIKPKVPPKTESIKRASVHAMPLTPPTNISKELGYIKPTSREQQSESITNNEPQTNNSYDVISGGADSKAVKIRPKVSPKTESIKRASVHSMHSTPPSNISKELGYIKPTSREQQSESIINNEPQINKSYDVISGGADSKAVKIKPKVSPKTESIKRVSVHAMPLTPPTNTSKELGYIKSTSREQQSESITNNEPQTNKSYDVISGGADSKAVKIKPEVSPKTESIKRASVHSKPITPPSNISKELGHVKPTSPEQLSALITNTYNEPQTNKRHEVISGKADNKPAKLKPKIPPKTESLKRPSFHSKPKVQLKTSSDVTTNNGQKDVFSECESIIMTSEGLGEMESGPIDQNKLYSTVVRPAKKESRTEAIPHIQTCDKYSKVECKNENVDKTSRMVCPIDQNDLYVSVEHIRNKKYGNEAILHKERYNAFSDVEYTDNDVRPKLITGMAKSPIDQFNVYASFVRHISEVESSSEPIINKDNGDVYSKVELLDIDVRSDTPSEMTYLIDENDTYTTISDDDTNKGELSSEALIPKQNCDIYAEVKRTKKNAETIGGTLCPIDQNELYATISDDDTNEGELCSESRIPKQNCEVYAEVKRTKKNAKGMVGTTCAKDHDQKFLRKESKIKRLIRMITSKTTKDHAGDLSDKSDRSLNVEETEETMSVNMMQNAAYDSVLKTAADDCFSVRIVKTEISDQLDLEGDFLMRLEEEKIALYDLDYKKRIHEWHFNVIRRYGWSGRLFIFEAGRKARTGPGMFKFETKDQKTRPYGTRKRMGNENPKPQSDDNVAVDIIRELFSFEERRMAHENTRLERESSERLKREEMQMENELGKQGLRIKAGQKKITIRRGHNEITYEYNSEDSNWKEHAALMIEGFTSQPSNELRKIQQ